MIGLTFGTRGLPVWDTFCAEAVSEGGSRLSAKYAVLGLVIERPGYGYQLAQRLQERFGSCAFAPSGVYSALDQLSREQMVRAAAEAAPRGDRRTAPRVIYEATEQGVSHFESWMLGSSAAPPLRDELHLKIALCRPRNLRRLIDTVYGQELACLSRLRDLTRLSELEAPDERRDWSKLMRVLSRDAEIASWRARIEWLQSARARLGHLLEEYERLQFIRARVVPPQPAGRATAAPVGSFERVERSRVSERRSFQATSRSTHPHPRPGGHGARPATAVEGELESPAAVAPVP